MTIELSVERVLADGDEFDIVLKDVGYSFDVDQHRSLRERGESLYQSLLVIERDPKHRILMGDLDALQSYPSGVYILIKTESDSKNKRRVFVGMTGSDKEMIYIRSRATNPNLAGRGGGHSPTLAQCLEEHNENCPPSMKEWDLAVIIPEERNAFFSLVNFILFFEKLKDLFHLKH